LGADTLGASDVHARAELCSKPVIDRGQQVVSFGGASYVMVGMYFARSHGSNAIHNGHRDLFYILRPISYEGDLGPWNRS